MIGVADPAIPGFLGRIVDGEGGVLGTCFQVAAGVLVTAQHVVPGLQEGDRVRVGQLDGSDVIRDASIVRVDPEHDLAVLKTPSPLRQSRGELSASDTVRPGTDIAVIGWAPAYDLEHDHEIHQSGGHWRGLARFDGGTRLCRAQLEGLVPGMSGAPVLRISDGAIIGVVSGRYNSLDGYLALSGWVSRTEDLIPLLGDLPIRIGDRRRRKRVALVSASLCAVGIAAVVLLSHGSAADSPTASAPSSSQPPGVTPSELAFTATTAESSPPRNALAPERTGGVPAPKHTRGDGHRPGATPTTRQPTRTPTTRPTTAPTTRGTVASDTTTLTKNLWLDADAAVMQQSDDQTAPEVDVHIGPDQWYPHDGARLGLRTGASCRDQALPAQTVVNFGEAGFHQADTAVLCLRSREGNLYQFSVTFLDSTGPYAPYRVTRTAVS